MDPRQLFAQDQLGDERTRMLECKLIVLDRLRIFIEGQARVGDSLPDVTGEQARPLSKIFLEIRDG